MAYPNNNLDDHPQYQVFDEWMCSQCFKTISATRPPIYNADNCSCVDLAFHTVGHKTLAEIDSYEQPVTSYGNTTHTYPHQAESYASSSRSVPCPEGLQHGNLDLHVNNDEYLPLVSSPQFNFNEAQQHQCTKSFNSYIMNRFLSDPDNHQTVYGTEHMTTPESRFRSQECYTQSSMKARKGSTWSKLSMESSRSGKEVFAGWGLDPFAQVGAWMSEGGEAYAENGNYPIVTSGMTERVKHDDKMN